MKLNPSLLVAVGYVIGMYMWATSYIGKPSIPEPFTWEAALTLPITLATATVLGWFAGKSSN